MKYEAGIVSAGYPNETHWSGLTVEAETSEEAEDKFLDLGFYRNLVVRETQ